MYKDINNKTGYRNLQGNTYLYGDLKLLNQDEKDAALADGIVEFTVPPKAAPTLEKQKEALNTRIKGERDRKYLDGVMVQSKWFHSDLESKQQQIALYTLGADLPVNVEWKTMDGSKILLTVELVAELFLAQISNNMAIFDKAELFTLDVASLTEETIGGFTFVFDDTYTDSL